MAEDSILGQIVVLNGAPRSGKSSIVRAVQSRLDGVWMNLGVDVFARQVTPPQFQPGIGLRPGPGPKRGGDRPDLEALVPAMFAGLYGSIAAHSRAGLNVVTDVGHHGAIHPGVLPDCARILAGLPALFVGVRCPIEEIMRRRRATAGAIGPRNSSPGDVLPAVVLWQEEVHKPGIYDLELDTSQLSPEDCADEIATRLRTGGPGTAFARLASSN